MFQALRPCCRLSGLLIIGLAFTSPALGELVQGDGTISIPIACDDTLGTAPLELFSAFVNNQHYDLITGSNGYTLYSINQPYTYRFDHQAVDGVIDISADNVSEHIVLGPPLPPGLPTDHLGEQKVLFVLSYFAGEDTTVSSLQVQAMVDEAVDWTAENSRDYTVNPDTSKTTWTTEVLGWFDLSHTEVGKYTDALWALCKAESALVDLYEPDRHVDEFDRFVFMYAESNRHPGEGDEGSFKSEFPFTAPCSPSSQGYYGTVSAYFSWLYNVNGGGVAAADIVHEVGHTYRLNHAFSISSMTDRWHPYGNWNDVMGMHPSGVPHLQAAHKQYLSWSGEAFEVTTSGTYYIHPIEKALQDHPLAHASLKVDAQQRAAYPSDGQYYYYVEFRNYFGFYRYFTYNQDHGALIHLVNHTGDGTVEPWTYALDATPETPAHSSYDNTLMLGRMYSDHDRGIYITAIDMNDNDGLEVRVNFRDEREMLGLDAANQPPTIISVDTTMTVEGNAIRIGFLAEATDPDPTDDLVYFWNFDLDWYQTAWNGDWGEELGTEFYDRAYNGEGPNFGYGQNTTHLYQDPENPRRAFLKVSDQWGGESEWYEIPLFEWTPTVRVVPSVDYPTIQAAIDSANGGDVVLVGEDGSLHTGPGNFELDLKSKRITLKANGVGVTIDASQSPPYHARCFRFLGNETIHTVVDGFTITGGNQTHLGDEGRGGAIWCGGYSRPVLRNCTIEDNVAFYGGGIYSSGLSRLTLENCEVSSNFAYYVGGGIMAEAAVGPADSAGSNPNQKVRMGAGGLYLRDTVIQGNTALQDLGGGLYYRDLIMEADTVWNERFAIEPTNVSKHRFYYQPTNFELTGCLVANNYTDTGGGIFFSHIRRRPLIVNTTIADCKSNEFWGGGYGGGIVFDNRVAETVMHNVIIWGNHNRVYGTPETIDLFEPTDADSIEIRYSCVENGWANAVGLTEEAPSFVWNHELLSDSPCIDAAEGFGRRH
jgi:hypothetical protein